MEEIFDFSLDMRDITENLGYREVDRCLMLVMCQRGKKNTCLKMNLKTLKQYFLNDDEKDTDAYYKGFSIQKDKNISDNIIRITAIDKNKFSKIYLEL